MALYNLVRCYTNTTGQDNLTLGAAVTGFLTFAQANVPNGGTVSYGIKDGNYSEVGRGVYNSGTLTRNVLASNDGGAKLFLSGLAEVFITVLAEDITSTTETDPVFLASEAASFAAGDKAKLDGIEAGAEVNNISDANATDLTDGGATTLHTHIIHYSKSAGVTTTGANTTPVNVSGAVFDYVASAVYRIWVMGRINSTAATTGIGVQFDLSSAVTAINTLTIHTLTTATVAGQSSIADDTSQGVTTGVPAGPLDVPFNTNALLVTGANTGTCQLRFRSETTAVTELLAGVVMVVERVA